MSLQASPKQQWGEKGQGKLENNQMQGQRWHMNIEHSKNFLCTCRGVKDLRINQHIKSIDKIKKRPIYKKRLKYLILDSKTNFSLFLIDKYYSSPA